MGAQQYAGRCGMKGVPHVPSRVMGRHIEQLEIRQIVLNLAAPVNLEPKVGENGADCP